MAFIDGQTIDVMEFSFAQRDFFLTKGSHHIFPLRSVAVKLRTNEWGFQQHVCFFGVLGGGLSLTVRVVGW